MTDEPCRVRAPVVRIVDHGSSTTVIGPRAVRRFDGDSAALLRAVLDIHRQPVTRTQLLAELAARAGLGSADSPVAPDALPALPTGPIDDLVAVLVDEGVLVAAGEPPRPPPGPLRRVVLGISGAIAAVDAPALIRGLLGIGCDVRVALTRAAARLVSPAALEALTHHAVAVGLWQRAAGAPVPHIQLAEWAELVVICPASATTLSRIATGDCSDLVAAIAAATRAPIVIAPSMNDAMYDSPAVRANLATLRDHGRHVVHAALGVELAHPPHARVPRLGPAPPAAAIVDIVRHLLRHAAAPRLPDGALAWEALWSAADPARLPWHTDALEPPLAAALSAHAAQSAHGRRLLDLGTGDGAVAVEAAARGYAVTATDVAPSALGRARTRAARAAASVLLVLDDITAPELAGGFDVAVDRGLLHCLPPERRHAYAAGVTQLIAPGGTLLIVAHAPGDTGDPAPASVRPAPGPRLGSALGTHGVTASDLIALLPAFDLVRSTPTRLAGAPAQLFELYRRAGPVAGMGPTEPVERTEQTAPAGPPGRR